MKTRNKTRINSTFIIRQGNNLSTTRDLVKIIINKEIIVEDYYTFSYSHTRNIELHCKNNKGMILFNLSKSYARTSEQYINGLINEGIKRFFLLHILLYNKPLKLNTILLITSDGKEIDFTDNVETNSLLLKSNFISIPESLKSKELLQRVVSICKSKQDSKIACLNAFIISRTVPQDSVLCFFYSWMSFNGFYNSLFPNDKTDTKKLGSFINQFFHGSRFLTADERKRVGKRIKVVLGQERFNINDLDDNNSNICISIRTDLSKITSSNSINIKGFIMVDFAYYLRCDLFHANHPAPILILNNDYEIRAMMVSQKLLDQFLAENIYALFSKTTT